MDKTQDSSNTKKPLTQKELADLYASWGIKPVSSDDPIYKEPSSVISMSQPFSTTKDLPEDTE